MQARIRQIGFPVRKKFDEFVFRYRPLDLVSSKTHTMLCEALSKKGLLKPRQWAIGHTKVFMRNLQQQELEEAREASLMTVVMKMQSGARRFICRCRYLKYKQILKTIKAAIVTRTEEALEASLVDVPELPFGGEHVPCVKEARKLKERLEDERRVSSLCADAVKARDLNELKGACKAADDIVFDAPVVREAKALRDIMEKEKAAVKRIRDAIDARSLDDIVAALAHGDTLGKYVVETDTYNSAVSLKERIEQENAARKALQKAISARSLPDLTAALAKCGELGLAEDIVKQAETLKEELEEQVGAPVPVAASARRSAARPAPHSIFFYRPRPSKGLRRPWPTAASRSSPTR